MECLGLVYMGPIHIVLEKPGHFCGSFGARFGWSLHRFVGSWESVVFFNRQSRRLQFFEWHRYERGKDAGTPGLTTSNKKLRTELLGKNTEKLVQRQRNWSHRARSLIDSGDRH